MGKGGQKQGGMQTQVLVALITAAGVVAAALITAVSPQCAKGEATPEAEAGGQSDSWGASPTPPPAEALIRTPGPTKYRDVFRPGDPYPRAIGDLRIGMSYDDVKKLRLGTRSEGGKYVWFDQSDGPFKTVTVTLSPSSSPTVEVIYLSLRDPQAVSDVLRDAEAKLGASRRTRNGDATWLTPGGVSLVVGGEVRVEKTDTP
ncbi:MAG: hypothetical protein KIS66_09365 [Fimbriimonadaceae bacterium]|nr:hypothetical protein [Fimbriimonadaceae bacterium]